MDDKRIYVIVPEIIFAATKVVQPIGRQFAQGIHAANELRRQLYYKYNATVAFAVRTTITLHVRDSKEMHHVAELLRKRNLHPAFFLDENPEYGPSYHQTAFAVLATEKQVENILGYLLLWGSK